MKLYCPASPAAARQAPALQQAKLGLGEQQKCSQPLRALGKLMQLLATSPELM